MVYKRQTIEQGAEQDITTAGAKQDATMAATEMIENFVNKLDEYAKIVTRLGLNVQPGQTIVIQSNIECQAFAYKVLDACYELGAHNVEMLWNDDYSGQQRIKKASEEAINNVPDYKVAFMNGYTNDGASILNIISDDPNSYDGLDESRIITYTHAKLIASTEVRERCANNKVVWSVAAVPNKAWAKKVFPELSSKEAVKALWDAIFKTCRINGDGKSLDRWEAHCENLYANTKKLNQFNLKSLRFKNSLGTNFTVDLPKDHIWMCATSCETQGGQNFIPNIPTEEIFTSPHMESVNGRICASMPLVLEGKIIDNFYFDVKEGAIVDIHAEKGEELLKRIIGSNPKNKYFGEVALVPYDSAISNLNVLFYNTLFDENASCHLAFGMAYTDCYKHGYDMNADELEKAGLNMKSPIHYDFMIGTSDLEIIGTKHNGEEIPIFKNGNFVI